MQHLHDGDDDPITPTPDSTGGPQTGDYQTDEDLPIPGEGDALDNSQLG